MDDPIKEGCGKCGADIDSSRRVDFTLKDETGFANTASSRKLRTAQERLVELNSLRFTRV